MKDFYYTQETIYISEVVMQTTNIAALVLLEASKL